jgi:elongation factor P hydroxylase
MSVENGTYFALSTGMMSITCCNCGMVFGVPSRWYQQRREDKAWWYCPQGHSQHFVSKSEAEKLRDELAAQKRRTEYFEADAHQARESAEAAKRQARAARGVVTRVKNRVGRGVCPCCNRFFESLHRHIQTKHPEYVHGEATAAPTAE